jgi:hypothetical protein
MGTENSPSAVATRTSPPVEPNTLKRRGVGLRACDTERACPGYTLFAPCFAQNRTLFLIDVQRAVVHTWTMPYAPGLGGYLTECGTLIYNGRTLETGFLSRVPLQGRCDSGGRLERQDPVGGAPPRSPSRRHPARNGNVLLNCLGQVPRDIAERAVGGAEDHHLSSGLYARLPPAEVGRMYADYLAELTPSGQTVWECAAGSISIRPRTVLPRLSPGGVWTKASPQVLVTPTQQPRRTRLVGRGSISAPASRPGPRTRVRRAVRRHDWR